MTKYKFNELPDWVRDDLYTRSYNLSDYHRIKSGSDLPTNDVVYLFVRGAWFNKFDLDLMERSNYDCLLHYYPGQFVECGGYYSLYLMYPIAPDIDDNAALDILTEYSERFSEYPWLEDENIVLDSQVGALIEEYVKGAK